MRPLIYAMLFLSVLLLVQLYSGEGGLWERGKLRAQLEERQEKNDALRHGNRILSARVKDEKRNLSTVEKLARSELGMIREGETFFWVVEEE